MLEELGLQPADEAVYRTVVGRRDLTVAELAQRCGLTPDQVRRACARLEQRRLVRRIHTEGAPASIVEATDPASGLQALILARQERLKQIEVLASELTERHRRAATATTHEELFDVLTGGEEITSRISQLQLAAREQLRGIDRPPYHDDSEANEPGEMEFLARGGRVRAIYDRMTLDYPGRLRGIHEAAHAGEEARVLAGAPTKIIIADSDVAIMPLSGGHGLSPAFIVVYRSALLDAMIAMFELAWQVATPIGQPVRAAGSTDGDLDERLLRLLDAGLPDVAIARDLGVSERTVRRHIHALLAADGLSSRYQLGLRRGLERS